MTAVEPMPDTDTAVAFFDALYRDIDDGWITLFSAKAGGTRVDWFPAGDIDNLARRAIARSNQNADVWFGVATRHKQLATGRGGADDCHQITGLWLDIDVTGPRHRNTDGLPPTLEAAYQILDRFQHPPTLVVASGGGLQPWWFLDEPVDIDPELLRRWHQTWVRIAHETGGWRIDNVSDPARIMRVPGTVNRKLPDDPTPVVIAECDPTRRYPLTDLAELLDDTPPPPARTPATTTFDPDDLRPGDEYNATHDGNDVLRTAGWHHHRRLTDGDAWRRPGKPDPHATHSAIVYDDGHICCYSDATDDTRLEKHRSYDPWGAHVAINHGGDFVAAAKAWRLEHPSTTPPREDWTAFNDLVDDLTDDPPNPDVFFTGSTGLNVALLAREAIKLGPVVEGRDDILWSYNHGVWSPDRYVIRNRAVRLLQHRYRRSHGTNTEDVVRATAPHISCDPIPELINFHNGLLDWRTGTIRDHTPEIRSTVQLGVNYQPDATCPLFDAFLASIVADDDIDLVWELIGYLMMSGNPLHRAVMLMGTGRNGKGTFLRVITKLLGPANVTSVSLHDLTGTRFAQASLFGKLANIAGDIDGTYIESTAMFKAITGEDTISAEHKGRDRFDFRPWCVPVFSANEVPSSADTTIGYLSRWLPIAFPNDFTGREDRTLTDKLTITTELEGIAARGVLALRDVMTRGEFRSTASTSEAKDDFRRKVDQVAAWADECVNFDPETLPQPRSVFYSAYKSWCDDNGGRPIGASKFYGRIEALGAIPKKIHGTRYLAGLKVTGS